MQRRHLIWSLAYAVLIITSASGEEPKDAVPADSFKPTHIAVGAVELVEADGRVVAIPARTKVSLSNDLRDSSDRCRVTTAKGHSGIAKRSAFSRLAQTIEVTPDAKQAAESLNKFALQLYSQVRAREGNIILSPVSVGVGLSITNAGAARQTSQEIMKVLHLADESANHQGFANLLDLLNCTQADNGYTVRSANRLWAAGNTPFEAAFLDVMRDKYRAGFKSIDFGDPMTARQSINNWVDDTTHHAIKDLVSDGVLSDQTRLVLANAIYFEGFWSTPFPADETKVESFHIRDKTIPASMMFQSGQFGYGETADLQILELPYRGGDMTMIVLLPKKPEGFEELEKNLSTEGLGKILESCKERAVEVHFPKFVFNTRIELADALKAMGMPSAFGNNADFTNMSRNEKLLLSNVLHQAMAEVNEGGTVAAAATANTIVPKSLPVQPVVFRADHPFVFAIRDRRTSALVFLGRLTAPLPARTETAKSFSVPARFLPTHVALEDVELKSPNGTFIASITKGSKVSHKPATDLMGDDCEIITAEGKSGMARSSAFGRLVQTIEMTPEVRYAAASVNQFAFDLYERLRTQEGNLMFAPASISTVLTMTSAGAANKTRLEMEKVLHLQNDQFSHAGFGKLLEFLNCSTGNGCYVSTVNRLWGSSKIEFETSYLKFIREQYRAELKILDFDHSNEAQQAINDWVQRHTRNKIKGLIPSGTVDGQTRLFLTSATYFEGLWETPFDHGETKQQPFHGGPKPLQVAMMGQQSEHLYGESEGLQIIRLPYKDGNLEMIVLLPTKSDGLSALEANLTVDNFSNWLKVCQKQKMVVQLPKFHLDVKQNLSATLRSLGMENAFSRERADFSALSNSENLMLSDVIHQVTADVDELGTVAAAATAVKIKLRSAASKQITFRADHPFVFAIHDLRSEAILFLGRVQNPMTKAQVAVQTQEPTGSR